MISAASSGPIELPKLPPTWNSDWARPWRPPEAMRATHTILMPQMSPVHFRPLEPLMRRLGYRVELLESATRDDLEVGLRYVNNDACFPAIMVIGQLVDADMNQESTRLAALQVQQQLGVQALSIANNSSQSILSLFR